MVLAWLEEEKNAPGLIEYYLMQLTAVIASIFDRRRGKKYSIKDFLIRFTARDAEPTPEQIEFRTQESKSRWKSWLAPYAKKKDKP